MQRLRVALIGLVTGLAFALAMNCAGAAVLGWGGAFSVKLDVLTHFSPLWFLGGLTAALIAVFLPRGAPRVMTFALGMVAVLAAGGLMAPEFLRPMSPRAPADAPHQLKLVQFNAWGFRGPRNIDVQWIAAQNPDVIVVEEATPEVRDALLAIRPYHVTCGDCTVMIFSLETPVTSFLARPKRWWPWAPTVRASFPAPGGAFDVVGVHYTWPITGTQAAQGYMLAQTLRQFPTRRLILAGDFNSTPWSFSRRREDKVFRMERRTKALFSWPAARFSRFRIWVPGPFLAIDHVYAGSDWKTVSVERGPPLGSDHYPVVVTLALDEQR